MALLMTLELGLSVKAVRVEQSTAALTCSNQWTRDHRQESKCYETLRPFHLFFFFEGFQPFDGEQIGQKRELWQKGTEKIRNCAKKKNVPLEVDWKITLFARSSPSAGSSKYSGKKSDEEWQTYFKDLTLSNFYEGN